MAIRYFALVYGIVFLVVGIAGFVPALVTAPDPTQPELAMPAGHGNLFGLFPVNIVHNLVHVIFGIWGLVAYRTLGASVTYARSVAVVYAVLVVLGLIPGLRTAFGLVPLYGNNVWLHVLLAGIAAYFGFFAERRPETPTATRA